MMKLYELPKGAKLKVGDRILKFIGIDGMYGRWLDKGELIIGYRGVDELKKDDD